ncbi:YndJ family protein [Halalkalibacillus halophilus]|uniref:YndJ family protein n=1 Tax=Halalkalibacillus halophilus TaxID=392827 RepID=UPI0003FEC89C|nr:YndJ family protein [Halalkalibacillus halophilus]
MKKFTITQAILGALLWGVSLSFLTVSLIEILLLFAILVILPLTLALTETQDRQGRFFKSYKLCVYAYPVAAVLALISFIYPPGLVGGMFSLGWLLWTLFVFFYGLSRLLARGFAYLEEVSIDVGLMYMALGGAWFSIFQFGIDVMDFGAQIILLTAIHFHFSALITPIFIGMLGRSSRQSQGSVSIVYRVMAVGVIISPMGIAIGITYSRLIEFMFVVVFVISLGAYAYYTVVKGRKLVDHTLAYLLLLLSSLTIVFTMLLAFYYGLGRLLRAELISIPDMVVVHGIGNAFGFVLLGVVGWLLVRPGMAFKPYGVTYSRLYGRWKIGADFFHRSNYIREGKVNGLVDDFDIFHQKNFNAADVDPQVKDFYENTLSHHLVSQTTWLKGFHFLSLLYKGVSSRIEQIDLPLNHEDQSLGVESEIRIVDSEKDGRDVIRAWVRTSRKTKKALFVAAYSYHKYDDWAYMNIALPLPLGQMTGILRPENKLNNLILTSEAFKGGKGDEGIYYVTKWFRIRLPIDERFVVWKSDKEKEDLKATHEMWMFGIQFLSIDYSISKR